LKNTSKGDNSYGYNAVGGSGKKKRNTTAWENDNLDSTKTKEQGGGWD
jgi:hypothetical protein